ncbi:MAG: hypothetical protein M0C28_30055 [Candidatus Moduliflexus flocculans]|nr:hypothetical protein [Candidatus Moduliflexus flocculans]
MPTPTPPSSWPPRAAGTSAVSRSWTTGAITDHHGTRTAFFCHFDAEDDHGRRPRPLRRGVGVGGPSRARPPDRARRASCAPPGRASWSTASIRFPATGIPWNPPYYGGPGRGPRLLQGDGLPVGVPGPAPARGRAPLPGGRDRPQARRLRDTRLPPQGRDPAHGCPR